MVESLWVDLCLSAPVTVKSHDSSSSFHFF